MVKKDENSNNNKTAYIKWENIDVIANVRYFGLDNKPSRDFSKFSLNIIFFGLVSLLLP